MNNHILVVGWRWGKWGEFLPTRSWGPLGPRNDLLSAQECWCWGAERLNTKNSPVGKGCCGQWTRKPLKGCLTPTILGWKAWACWKVSRGMMARDKATLPFKQNFPGHKNTWTLVFVQWAACLEGGKEAFTCLSNLNVILGVLEKGDIGAWLSLIPPEILMIFIENWSELGRNVPSSPCFHQTPESLGAGLPSLKWVFYLFLPCLLTCFWGCDNDPVK